MAGTESFFGGLLEGLGTTVLTNEQRQYEQRLRDAQSRQRAIEALLNSGDLYPEEVAPAIKALLAPSLQSPTVAAKFGGAVKRAVTGKKAAPQGPSPVDQFFSSFESLRAGRQQPAVGRPAATQPQTETVATPGLAPAVTPQATPPMPKLTVRQLEAQQASQMQIQREAELRLQQNQIDWEERKKRAEIIDPTHGQAYQDYLAGWTPKEPTLKLVYGAEIDGKDLPANAVDLSGIKIPDEGHTEGRKWNKYKYGSEFRYEPARPRAGGMPSQFQQWMNAASSRKGSPLTPDETQAEIIKYSRLNRPSVDQIYQDTKAREQAKIDIAQEYPQLTPAGQTALTNVEPTIGQIDELLARLEQPDENGIPLKENNVNLYFTANRTKYALGIAPEEAELAGQIANLELVKITGAMPYATRSRNFQYIKQIQLHLPNAWVDSPKNVYQKLVVAKKNMERIRADILKNDIKGKVSGGLSEVPTPSGPNTKKRVKFEDLPE